MLDKLFYVTLYSCVLCVWGCNSPPSSTDSSAAVNDGDDEYSVDSMEGWEEIHEPFGDESMVHYKIVPDQIALGEPVEIQLQAGSVYGPITEGKLMVRLTSGSETNEFGNVANPKDGPEWQEAELKSIVINTWDEETDEDKVVRLAPGDKAIEQYAGEPGHAEFTISVTPTAETPKIELRTFMAERDYGSFKADEIDFAFDITPNAEAAQ